MVAAIRRSVAQKRAYMERSGHKYDLDPVEYLEEQLVSLGIRIGGLEYSKSAPISPITHKPMFPKLLMAWDAISLPFLKNEWDKGRREGVIKSYVGYFEPTITLRPKEAKLLDAMADAAGIPRTHGETEIDLQKHLPEHLARHIGERLGNDARKNP